MPDTKPQNQLLRSSLTLSPLPLLLLLAACFSDENSGTMRADMAAVIRGPMTISVTEMANIRAANETRVKSQMEGQATVIFLIKEGTVVKKGDKLVELDASNQIERRASQEITVEKSNASVVTATKELEILRKQVDSEIRAAENEVEFCHMDERKFYGDKLADGNREMGEKQQNEEALMAEIKLAESQLALAKDRYQWSVKLRAKDFITKEDLERDKLDHEAKQTNLTLARNRLEILRKYTHEKTKLELEQRLRDAGVDLTRVKARGEAKIAQAEADLKSNVKENELAKERLENLERQIRNAVVLAPTPGIVVYGFEGDHRRRRYIEVGASVRERQNLILLPDVSKMEAELSVPEAMVEKVKVGQRARIMLDTIEEELYGTVTRRAPLPDSSSRWGNPDLKVYKTIVTVDGNNEDNKLKPGMSATVEIIVEIIEDAISIPIQAQRRQGSVNYAWVETASGPVARKVQLGSSNITHIQVLEGLKQGEKVYLAVPPGAEVPEFEQPKREPLEIPSRPAPGELAGPGRGMGKGQRPTALEASGSNGGKAVEGGPAEGGQRPRRERGEGQDRGRGGGRMGSSPMGSFTELLKEKRADLHAKVQGNFSAWRDPEITKEFESDPDLKDEWAKVQEWMQQMRSRRGSGEGRGERGGRGSRDGTGMGGGNRGRERERRNDR